MENIKIDRASFFSKLRITQLFSIITQEQVTAIEAIINEAEIQGITIPQLAYCLATTYHECHNPKKPQLRMLPMAEFGSELYLKSKPYYPYYGRGQSQCTHKENYKKAQKYLAIKGIIVDLVNNPDLLLKLEYSAPIHVYAMKTGMYTGKKLSDFINDIKKSFVAARSIINGHDQASLIASYANRFLICLGQ